MQKLVAVVINFAQNFAPSFCRSRGDAISAGEVVEEEAETSLDCRRIIASITVCCNSCRPVGKVIAAIAVSVVWSRAFSFWDAEGTN